MKVAFALLVVLLLAVESIHAAERDLVHTKLIASKHHHRKVRANRRALKPESQLCAWLYEKTYSRPLTTDPSEKGLEACYCLYKTANQVSILALDLFGLVPTSPFTSGKAVAKFFVTALGKAIMNSGKSGVSQIGLTALRLSGPAFEMCMQGEDSYCEDITSRECKYSCTTDTDGKVFYHTPMGDCQRDGILTCPHNKCQDNKKNPCSNFAPAGAKCVCNPGTLANSCRCMFPKPADVKCTDTVKAK